MLRAIVSAVCAAGAVCGAGYYALCLVSIRSFLRERAVAAPIEELPAVSVLKPLKGMDAGMYESFRSHCFQDYGVYEIIFGVSDLEDAAVAYVRQLQAEFPQREISLVVCPDAEAMNRKVGNLAQMLPHARYNFMVVNDSDIWAPPEYLRVIMRAFQNSKVGMVTAPYYGAPGRSLWSRIEAIGISTDFIAGVLAARRIEGGIKFGLGSTLAMSREALDAIGGFAPLADYLGDDYELGARIANAGYEVVLSRVVVRTHLPDYSWRGFWQHQLRWSRGIRDSRKKDFVGLGATFG
ncbi:MAG: glycosyltransferase, partial [Acidobacteriaceae bacterium]